MDQKRIVERVKSYVKMKLEKEGTGHDWWHIERVYKIACYLAKQEGADLFTVQLAALLHDISDHKFNDGNSEVGARIAYNLLIEYGCSEQRAKNVFTIVNTLSFKGGTVNSSQSTLEGEVVQDADRLDAIGAIGIARTFAYGGNKGRELYNPNKLPKQYKNFDEYKTSNTPTINHFYEKLLLLKDLMNTENAKIVAINRTKFMKQYLEQFYIEWDAKDIVN